MRKTQFILVLCLLLPFVDSAQIRPVPNWVREEKPDLAMAIKEEAVSDGYFYLLVDEQYNTILDENFFHYVTKVVSETGLQESSSIEFNFDPSYQTAAIHYIHIYRNGQLLDRSKTESIRQLDSERKRNDALLEGEKTVYVSLTDVRKGDIVEYAYSRKGKNSVFKEHHYQNFQLNYSIEVGDLKYRVLYAPTANVKCRLINSARPATIVKTEKSTEYSWFIHRPKPGFAENNIPSWFEAYEGVELSDFEDWLGVKKWSKSVYNLDAYDDHLLKKLVDSVQQLHPDQVEKQLTVLTNYVQNSVRYLGNESGIYSHQPHSPAFVLKNHYGDCKDKSMLLCELFRHLKKEVYPVLVSTTLCKKVDQHLASTAWFDHCIMVVIENGKRYYIDPTETYQGGSYKEKAIGDFGLAMILDTSNLAFTEIERKQFPATQALEQFYIENDGRTRLNARYTYYGSAANTIRSYMHSNSRSDAQDAYRKFYDKYETDVKVLDTLSYEDDFENNTLTTVESYELAQIFTKKDSASLKKNVSFLPYFLNGEMIYSGGEKRAQPLQIKTGVNISQTITVELADGWNMEDTDFSMNDEFLNYSYQRKVNGTQLSLIYTLKVLNDVVPSEKFAQYTKNTDLISENMVMAVDYLKGSDERGKTLNWLLLSILGVVAVAGFFLFKQINAINIPSSYSNIYYTIGGWLVLVGIGLVLSPLMLLYQIGTQFFEELYYDYYGWYFNTASDIYDPFRGAFLILVPVLNFVILVLSLTLAVLFFKKRNSFRMLYMLVKLFHLLVLVFVFFMNREYYDVNSERDLREMSTAKAEILRFVIQCAIWIPYVWFSERSRGTFTESAVNVQSQLQAHQIDPDKTRDKEI